MASSSKEFYNWLIRVTTAIRAHKFPQESEPFEIFCRELGKVLQFDQVAKYDAASNTFHWYVGFEELNEGLKKSTRETSEHEILSLWVHRHQQSIVLGNLDKEARFPDTIRCLRRAGLQSVCTMPLSDAHRRLGSLVIAGVLRDAYSAEDGFHSEVSRGW